MHIVIDARLYQQGLGLGRYIQQLLSHLEQEEGDERYSILLRKNNWDLYTPSSPRFTKVLADIPWYSWEEQIKIPHVLRALKPDLVHFPHMNVPFMYRDPFVVTIHDLILFSHPESATSAASTRHPFVYWCKLQAYRYNVRVISGAAKHIITVSEYSKKMITKYLGIQPPHVSVTYEAPFPHASQLTGSMKAKPPLLLYAGNAYPHKNLETLLNACTILKKKGIEFMCVMVGQDDFFTAKLRETIREKNLEDVVEHRGYVDDAVLETLYLESTLYVFPSKEEGFGLPALEAMDRGLPVLASRASCLPEVCGDAACYFDPESAEDCSEKIIELLNDEALREDLVHKGKEHASQFSWSELAQKTLAIYRHARTI